MNKKRTLGIAAVMLSCFVAIAEAQSRQSSGSSGSVYGFVIGVIVGLIVLFLVCRELICWYYKINKIVELMEQQNSLLNSLVGKFTSSPSVDRNNSPISNEASNILNYKHRVVRKTSIKEKPDSSSNVSFDLDTDDIVSIMEIGEQLSGSNYWVNIKTEDGRTGWCTTFNNLAIILKKE